MLNKIDNMIKFEAYDFKHQQPVKVKCEGNHIILSYRYWMEEVENIPSYIKEIVTTHTLSIVERKTGKQLYATPWEDVIKVHYGWGSEEYTQEEFKREFEVVEC